MTEESIQSMGGKARAGALSDEQRKEIAAKAAAARWGKAVKAIRKGNFKDHFGTDVECYVLDDINKTAVISQTGMARALGMSPRGKTFPKFLASKAMVEVGGAELQQKFAQPIEFEWRNPGADQLAIIGHGYDATLLIDVCQSILKADNEGKLNPKRYEKIVAQAQVIVTASAKSGIKNLIWALAGYDPTAQEVIEAFKTYVLEEAKKYEKEFPNELYEQWYRLYQIPVPARGKPWNFKNLTIQHVYYPLAKSRGKILELIRALKSQGGDRKKKLFQFLSDTGTRALRFHLGRLVQIAEDSADRATYERKIIAKFGGQHELAFMAPELPAAIPKKEPAEQLQMFPES